MWRRSIGVWFLLIGVAGWLLLWRSAYCMVGSVASSLGRLLIICTKGIFSGRKGWFQGSVSRMWTLFWLILGGWSSWLAVLFWRGSLSVTRGSLGRSLSWVSLVACWLWGLSRGSSGVWVVRFGAGSVSSRSSCSRLWIRLTPGIFIASLLGSTVSLSFGRNSLFWILRSRLVARIKWSSLSLITRIWRANFRSRSQMMCLSRVLCLNFGSRLQMMWLSYLWFGGFSILSLSWLKLLWLLLLLLFHFSLLFSSFRWLISPFLLGFLLRFHSSGKLQMSLLLLVSLRVAWMRTIYRLWVAIRRWSSVSHWVDWLTILVILRNSSIDRLGSYNRISVGRLSHVWLLRWALPVLSLRFAVEAWDLVWWSWKTV